MAILIRRGIIPPVVAAGGTVSVDTTAAFEQVGSTVPKAFTIASNSNRAIAIGVIQFTGSLTTASVTYAGVSVPMIGSLADSSAVFGLCAPATGTNDIVVTHDATFVDIFALSVYGANQTGGTTTFHDFTHTGNGSSTTVGGPAVIASAVGEILFASFIGSGSDYTTPTTGTSIGNFGTAGGSNPAAASYASGASPNVSMGYNLGAIASGVATGFSIKAA